MVNNAGVSTFGEVEFASVDTYKQVSEVNLFGTIRVTKAVLPLIRRAKGKTLLYTDYPVCYKLTLNSVANLQVQSTKTKKGTNSFLYKGFEGWLKSLLEF